MWQWQGSGLHPQEGKGPGVSVGTRDMVGLGLVGGVSSKCVPGKCGVSRRKIRIAGKGEGCEINLGVHR